jgi:hypothetical protein
MIALGFTAPEPLTPSVTMNRSAGETLDLWDDWEVFFMAAASLDTPRPLTAAERWRYPDLATPGDALGTGNATLTAVAHAFTTDLTLLAGCMRATARAARLDLPAISAEAAVVLEKWPADNRDVINVMFAPPPAFPPAFDSARLDDQDKEALTGALAATSEWLAEIARTLLPPAHDPAAGARG